MRLIDGDEIEELFREVISGIAKKQEMTKNLEHMVRASAMVIEMLNDAPTVDAVPVRRGKWKHKKDLKQFFCDQCGEPSLTEDDVYFYGMDFPNFCPNCGADMRKDGGDNVDE